MPACQVRNNQVPKPRAMVEDILARVSLLDGELMRYTGQQAQAACTNSPRSGGSSSAAAPVRLPPDPPQPAEWPQPPMRTSQVFQ